MSSCRGESTAADCRRRLRGDSERSRPLLEDELGLGVADDRAPVLLGDGVDDGDAVLDAIDLPGHRDLALEHPHPAERDAQALERVRAAGRLGLRAGDLGHRPEAVEDLARQPDLLGEVVVDVDRVEVARRTGVADGQVPVRRDLDRRDLVARAHPRTMFDQVPTHTVSPSWFSETDSNVYKPISPRAEISLTMSVVLPSSPAMTSGPQRNSWPLWSSRAKSMPTSGSNIA